MVIVSFDETSLTHLGDKFHPLVSPVWPWDMVRSVRLDNAELLKHGSVFYQIKNPVGSLSITAVKYIYYEVDTVGYLLC